MVVQFAHFMLARAIYVSTLLGALFAGCTASNAVLETAEIKTIYSPLPYFGPEKLLPHFTLYFPKEFASEFDVSAFLGEEHALFGAEPVLWGLEYESDSTDIFNYYRMPADTDEEWHKIMNGPAMGRSILRSIVTGQWDRLVKMKTAVDGSPVPEVWADTLVTEGPEGQRYEIQFKKPYKKLYFSPGKIPNSDDPQSLLDAMLSVKKRIGSGSSAQGFHFHMSWKMPVGYTEQDADRIVSFLVQGNEWAYAAALLEKIPITSLFLRNPINKPWAKKIYDELVRLRFEPSGLATSPVLTEVTDPGWHDAHDALAKYFMSSLRVGIYQNEQGELDPSRVGYEFRHGAEYLGFWFLANALHTLVVPEARIKMGDRGRAYALNEISIRNDVLEHLDDLSNIQDKPSDKAVETISSLVASVEAAIDRRQRRVAPVPIAQWFYFPFVDWDSRPFMQRKQCQKNFVSARTHYEQSLQSISPSQDRDVHDRMAVNSRAVMNALTTWAQESELARDL